MDDYLVVSGRSGPYLAGRGFVWIDLQDGLALGGFYSAHRQAVNTSMRTPPAWMITGDDQVAWLQVRDNTCRVGRDPLGCHIRLTRE
jgi:hypothetical protein